MERRTLSVKGMACGGCEDTVENALETVDGVDKVEADHENATVEIAAEDAVSDDTIAAAIHDAGYEYAGEVFPEQN